MSDVSGSGFLKLQVDTRACTVVVLMLLARGVYLLMVEEEATL